MHYSREGRFVRRLPPRQEGRGVADDFSGNGDPFGTFFRSFLRILANVTDFNFLLEDWK